jgi:hypothetical protein
MMRHLGLEEGATAIVTNMPLEKATYLQMRPHQTSFTQLSNPKAM